MSDRAIGVILTGAMCVVSCGGSALLCFVAVASPSDTNGMRVAGGFLAGALAVAGGGWFVPEFMNEIRDWWKGTP